VRCATTDHSSEVTLVRSIKMGRIKIGANNFDGFKRVGIAEGNEFSCNKVRAL
jgi:hypothetical protein